MDYLAIGHVTKDLIPGGARLGGTVTFASLTAQALSLRVGVLTSAPDDIAARQLLAPLRSLETLVVIPSETFTTFENIYRDGRRVQTLSGRAAPLTPADVSARLKRPGVVHLAPLADEVDPALAGAFPAALVGVTPQGWLRAWDDAGRVAFRRWPEPGDALSHTAAVVMSIEDVANDERYVEELASLARVLVVTRGADGCTLFCEGERIDIPAPRVQERDPTGAGDVFAAAFFARLHAVRDPLAAALCATQLASASVTREGIASIPTPDEVAAALRADRSQDG
jgi:sugar/nucleoside kinase (ribokinase family)